MLPKNVNLIIFSCYSFHLSVLDDYYILYTILYHNFNIGFVSRDLLRDHLYHLDSTSRVDFQRWQAANQYILESFTDDNKPVLSVRTFFFFYLKIVLKILSTFIIHISLTCFALQSSEVLTLILSGLADFHELYIKVALFHPIFLFTGFFENSRLY